MTINELYNIWYDGNRLDINFINACCNMLNILGGNVLHTDEDLRKYDELRNGIKYAMEDWLYDHK